MTFPPEDANAEATAVRGTQRSDLTSGMAEATAGGSWPDRIANASDRAAVYHAYLESPEWAAKRAIALRRAQGRCQLCNMTKRLQVHHRTYERIGAEAIEDLTVLCRPCHRIFHGLDSPPLPPPPKKRRRLCPGCGKNQTKRKRCSECKRKSGRGSYRYGPSFDEATQAAIEEELRS